MTMLAPTIIPPTTTRGSDYEVSLDPPAGTSFFKQYTKIVTPVVEHVFESNPIGQMSYKLMGDISIKFYVYVTLHPANVPGFTENGGKVYIVARIDGEAQGELHTTVLGSTVIMTTGPTMFQFELEDVTSNQLLTPATVLPRANQASDDGDDRHTYSWNYAQKMSMFTSNGNLPQDFTAVDRENFTVQGWKQTPNHSRASQGYKSNRIDGETSYIYGNVSGVQVWESSSLGKASLKLKTTMSLFSGLEHSTDETYVLDFSAETMSNARAASS